MKKEISFSNPKKILFPSGISKEDIIKYYFKISKLILPHLKDRCLIMERYPNGINDKKFFQKNAPSFTPKWIKKELVKNGTKTNYMTYSRALDRKSVV